MDSRAHTRGGCSVWPLPPSLPLADGACVACKFGCERLLSTLSGPSLVAKADVRRANKRTVNLSSQRFLWIGDWVTNQVLDRAHIPSSITPRELTPSAAQLFPSAKSDLWARPRPVPLRQRPPTTTEFAQVRDIAFQCARPD